jgi:flagellar M-ring protein FliF
MSRRRGKPEPTQKVVPAQVRPTPALDVEEVDALSPPAPTVQDEVAALVEKQPEEIASLLRGWLADRRAGV